MASADVVIPTYNEAPWLERLLIYLGSIAEIRNVIVADACSRDTTVEIARSYSCTIASGGSPGVGRNRGAEASNSDILIFLDADVVPPRRSIHHAIVRLSDASGVVAMHFPVRPLTRSRLIKAYFHIANSYCWLMGRLGIPIGIGCCLAVRREAFFMAGGFNENLKFGEDIDILRRIKSQGKVEFARSFSVACSSRRFQVENHVILATKVAIFSLLRTAGIHAGGNKSYRPHKYDADIARSESNLYKTYLGNVNKEGRRDTAWGGTRAHE